MNERRHEPCRPGESRKTPLLRPWSVRGKRRILAGFMDDVAAVQEHRRLEQSMRDEMEHRQRKRAQAAFHDHVAHLADGGKPECFLDVVLREHHAGAENRGERADDEGHMQGRRAQTEERSQAIDQKPAGIDDARMQQAHAPASAHRETGEARCAAGNWADLPMPPMNSSKVTAVAPLISMPGSSEMVAVDSAALREQFLEFQRAVEGMGERNPGKKCHVADPQEGKRSKGAFQCRGMRVVVRQHIQQVTQELPKDEQHQRLPLETMQSSTKVVIPTNARYRGSWAILIHVPDGVSVDDRADARDQHHHDRAEPVDIKTQRESQGRSSRVVELETNRSLRRDEVQRRDGAAERRADRISCQSRARASRAIGSQYDQKGSQQWEQRHKQHYRLTHSRPPQT